MISIAVAWEKFIRTLFLFPCKPFLFYFERNIQGSVYSIYCTFTTRMTVRGRHGGSKPHLSRTNALSLPGNRSHTADGDTSVTCRTQDGIKRNIKDITVRASQQTMAQNTRWSDGDLETLILTPQLQSAYENHMWVFCYLLSLLVADVAPDSDSLGHRINIQERARPDHNFHTSCSVPILQSHHSKTGKPKHYNLKHFYSN